MLPRVGTTLNEHTRGPPCPINSRSQVLAERETNPERRRGEARFRRRPTKGAIDHIVKAMEGKSRRRNKHSGGAQVACLRPCSYETKQDKDHGQQKPRLTLNEHEDQGRLLPLRTSQFRAKTNICQSRRGEPLTGGCGTWMS